MGFGLLGGRGVVGSWCLIPHCVGFADWKSAVRTILIRQGVGGEFGLNRMRSSSTPARGIRTRKMAK